ncbi:hypothetical protein HPP92_001876 [Vanilla planifolia]|uniref:Uncharacterized protein n=1 Tax=Vanilla planifolia TaxID=51239 RepID=A0A835VHG4_VANPL|nr:hypothetical protein HPP92_001876 [Vanilla planifolia]
MSSPPWGYCPSPGGDQGNASSSDEDVDTLRRLEQSFSAKPGDCRSTAGDSGDDLNSCSDAESSASEDVAYLRRLQEKFSADLADSGAPSTPPIVNPIRSFPPPDTDDEEDFETLRAIQRRFAHYWDAMPQDFSREITVVVSTETYERCTYGMSLGTEMNEEIQLQGHSGLNQDGEESRSLFAFSKFADNHNDVPKVVQDNVPVLPDASLMNTSRNEENSEKNHSNLNQTENVLCTSSIKPCRSLRIQKVCPGFCECYQEEQVMPAIYKGEADGNWSKN